MSHKPKPSTEVRASRELIELIQSLDPQHKIRRWIEDMKQILLEDMLAGERVPKRLIPKYYVERHGVNNLWRFDHPEGYRSIYTLIPIEGKGVCPIIIEFLSHPEYDRRFGYR